MAFFDDLGKRITQTSQGVVQKTKDTAEVIRLNSMITDEEKNINELYVQIGRKYFEMHSNSFEQVFENMINGIKESQNNIAEYSNQVKKLKGIVKCPNCGGDVSYGAPFCSSCGSKMTFEKEAKEGGTIISRCNSCGSPIYEGDTFCTNCGAKVKNNTNDNISANNVTDTVNLCPNCNTHVSSEADFCINCGYKLKE